MKYHFACEKGWMSSPCGAAWFMGEYHVFFQHYPYAPRWGQMHWGHVTTKDLVSWKEQETALTPELDYENGDGCLPGSVIVKDGRMYLFYTASGAEKTVAMAYTDDGKTFVKYENNPIIKAEDGCEIRDPYVWEYKGKYLMLVGGGRHHVGRISLYESDNLTDWKMVDTILEDGRFGGSIETPELFKLEDKWVIMFQGTKSVPHRIVFGTGEFDGTKLYMEDDFEAIEIGPDLYSPMSFEDQRGRRIVIGWMYRRSQVGMFSSPRELSLDLKDKLVMLPIDELLVKTVKESSFVCYGNGRLMVSHGRQVLWERAYAYEPEYLVLEDVGTVEVFAQGGRENITVYVC